MDRPAGSDCPHAGTIEGDAMKWNKHGYDFTRHIFTTTDPDKMASLVGQKIRGMNPVCFLWIPQIQNKIGYLIESFDGKRGVALELREEVNSPYSLRHLPMCLIDYIELRGEHGHNSD